MPGLSTSTALPCCPGQLRLSYGFALSLVHGLEHKGIDSPLDATGRRLNIVPADGGTDAASVPAQDATPVPAVKAKFTITARTPLYYRLPVDSASEHAVALAPSTMRADDFHDEMSARPGVPMDTVLTRYFAGESPHGSFEVLVSCRRMGAKAHFEVEDVTVVVKHGDVEILQLPTFTITEDTADPAISAAG